jgi:hypothetical protein
MHEALHKGIKIHLNPIKYVPKSALIPSITNFIYAITFNIFQNTIERKELFALKVNTSVYMF